MTSRQERFVEEFLVDLNATQAAIRAGYSKKTARVQASQLLTKLNIQEAIAEAKTNRIERIQLNQNYVLTRLVENVERAMQNRPVLDAKGDPTGEYVYAGTVANKALELLGKHLGMFQDRIEVNDLAERVAATKRGRERALRRRREERELEHKS